MFARLLIVAGLGLATLAPVNAAELKAVTANLSPMSISPEKKGFNHELVEEMVARAGHTITIEYLPWKRSQDIAKSTPETLIFGMTRTAAREPHHDWVVPLVRMQDVLATTTGTDATSLDDIPMDAKILVLEGTPRDRKATEHGFSNITRVADPLAAAKMLNAGRVDIWYANGNRTSWAWKAAGLDMGKLKISAALKDNTAYLAAHPNYPADIAADLNAAIESMKADGSYDALYEKYFGMAPPAYPGS